MKPLLIFAAFVALFYFVPSWLILAIIGFGTLAIWLMIVLFMVFIDFL